MRRDSIAGHWRYARASCYALVTASATRYHRLPNLSARSRLVTMAQPMPPIAAAVGLAYGDLARVPSALGRVAVVALTIVLVSDQAERLVLAPGVDSGNATALASFVLALVQTFLITPYLIAVHRLVVLDEATQAYVLAPLGNRRLQVYFLCWAALSVLATVPAFLPPLSELDQPVAGFIGFAVLGYLAGVMVFGLRMTLLFPAIAVDAPGASFAHALADAKGHVWRILATGLLAGVPVMMLAYLTQGVLGTATDGAALVVSLVRSVVAFVLLTQFVVISSRLYMWLGDHLARPE